MSQFEELVIDLDSSHPRKLLPFLLCHDLAHNHWHVAPTLKGIEVTNKVSDIQLSLPQNTSTA